MHRISVCIIAALSYFAPAVMSAQNICGYGLVSVDAACMRAEPSNASELETQASYGAPLRLLGRSGEWWRVKMADGYEAYVNESAIAVKDSAEMARWRKSPRIIVTTPYPTRMYADSIGRSARNVVCDVTIGAIFEGAVRPGAHYVEAVLTDGRRGYLRSIEVEDFELWSKQEPHADKILDTAYSMNGVTYLWGGTTPKALDCSGLTKVCYLSCGVMLPRNASEQALSGVELAVGCPGDFRPGDLLFFGSGDGDRITHVGIYEGGGRFIHASGRVFVSSIDPADTLYIPRRVLKAVRIIGEPYSGGTVAVNDHPWYFDSEP